MAATLLLIAALLQGLAVAYAVYLLTRRQGATSAWLFLLGAMLSMLVWRIVIVSGFQPPPFFNPLIAIWGSTCMVAAMFLFGREVAMRRKAEAERDALLASERSARTEAERANRAKDEFLGTLSHELRTPLASILSWCEIWRNPRVSAQDKERAVLTIERNARTQARLIDDLLDVTRMQAGKLHLEVGVVSLDAPVRAAVQAIGPAAAAKAIEMDLTYASPPPRVRVDLDRMQQVAANLLVNAVKFTPPNGEVTVIVDAQNERARLAVADTGEGIDPDFIPQLFGRFRQADSSTSRRHGGLGLGLSIVDYIVRAHGGEVQVASPGRDRGATFVVTLPLAPTEASLGEGSGVEPPVAMEGSTARLTGVRVVVIDDEDDVRAGVTQLLEQLGAEVLAFASGAQIESTLLQQRPHVLLIDISMPNEDGYSLVRRIRRLPRAAGGATPAISLTAHARNEDRARALSAGFQQHLPKPIDTAALASAIIDVAFAADGQDAADRRVTVDV